MLSHELTEQERIRRESLAEIKAMNINPYPPHEYKVSHHSTDIQNNFEQLDAKEVSISGRITSRRIMGKASFIELKDSKGRLQVYVNRDEICPEEDKEYYNNFFKKLLDIGDIIGITGVVFKTKVGETSVKAKTLKLLSKSLKPLPAVKIDDQGVVHDAFKDIEHRHRHRYLDLIVNDNVKKVFDNRNKAYSFMRDYFNQDGYMEVETPVLQNIPGGALARPFVTHHNVLDIPFYLRISNELYLKRLIVGGYEGVYEFSKDFRNEGMDRTHNPEFTVMELYVAYKDYFWMMDFTENMLKKMVLEICGKDKIEWNGKEIDFSKPFARVPILDIIKEKTGHDLYNKSEEEIRDVCKKIKVPVKDSYGVGKMIDKVFGDMCEPYIIQPTYIIDYPVEMSPLTKDHRTKKGLTERFELIINTKEIANAYTELNDPIEQLERFNEQFRLSEKGDDESMFIDIDFVRALEFAMPPTSGIGIGMDRLVMMLTNQASIQEVLFFPQMKPEKHF